MAHGDIKMTSIRLDLLLGHAGLRHFDQDAVKMLAVPVGGKAVKTVGKHHRSLRIV